MQYLSGITFLIKPNKTELKQYKKTAIRIIFSTMYDTSYASALYIANLPALVD